MAILRFIDADGRENDVENIDQLYELIQARQIGLQSLVWDDREQRWQVASDHEFFRRIREISAAASTPAPVRPPLQPWAKPPIDPPKLTAGVSAPSLDKPTSPPPVAALNTKPAKKESFWFKAIHTREEALKMVRDTSTSFFAIAALQCVIGVWMATQYPDTGFDVSDTIITVTIYVIFAAWLRWGRSRIAALVLLLAATVALGTTLAALLKIIPGGRNVWLSLIVFWAGVKAVEATFKLRGRFKEKATEEPQFS
jgi:hypothetical protein